MRDENEWLFLTGTAYNSRLGRSLSIILEAVCITLFNLSFSFTVKDPNRAVIENVRTLSIAAW